MEIKFLSVGCGDGIIIRCLGGDNQYHNIIIDGGVERGKVYEYTLKQEIKQIIERKERIDLWIITHTDDDHIGGLLRFIADKEFAEQNLLENTEFWVNDSTFNYKVSTTADAVLLSPDQSIRLRTYLTEKNIAVRNDIYAVKEINYYGLKLTVLSPVQEIAVTEDTAPDTGTSVSLRGQVVADWDKKNEDFTPMQFTEDSKPEHQNCIALLLEYNNKKALLTSDCYPSVVVESLTQLGYSLGNKLNVEFMQLAHHGSKYNTSLELLEMIDCDKFVISADGFNNHKLPNKETMVRVINIKDNPVEFYITEKNEITQNIFRVDIPDVISRLSLVFPKDFSNALTFQL